MKKEKQKKLVMYVAECDELLVVDSEGVLQPEDDEFVLTLTDPDTGESSELCLVHYVGEL